MTTPGIEPTITLPTRRLLVAAVAIPVIAAGVWWAVCVAAAREPAEIAAGGAGAVVAMISAVVGLLVISPWRPRLVGDWMNMWLAATVVRMLLAPGLAILLYSATPLPGTPLALAVGLTYLATLFGEAGLLTRYLHRVLPDPGPRRLESP